MYQQKKYTYLILSYINDIQKKMSPLTPSVFCWKSPGEGDMELSEADLHTIKVQTVWNVEICDQNWQFFWYEKTWNKLTASIWGRNLGYFFWVHIWEFFLWEIL